MKHENTDERVDFLTVTHYSRISSVVYQMFLTPWPLTTRGSLDLPCVLRVAIELVWGVRGRDTTVTVTRHEMRWHDMAGLGWKRMRDTIL